MWTYFSLTWGVSTPERHDDPFLALYYAVGVPLYVPPILEESITRRRYSYKFSYLGEKKYVYVQLDWERNSQLANVTLVHCAIAQ